MRLNASAGFVRQARTLSEDGWGGTAGDGFRTYMGRATQEIDSVADRAADAALALERFADDQDTVRARMGQAVDVAVAAGLAVSATTIADPGSAPPLPGPPPTGASATPQLVQTHAAALDAHLVYLGQVRAYRAAAEIVAAARRIEQKAMDILQRFVSYVLEAAPATALSTLVDRVAERLKRPSRYLLITSSYVARAQESMTMVVSGRVVTVAASIEQRISTTRIEKVFSSQADRALDHLPGWAKKAFTLDIKTGLPVVKRIPVLGLVISAASVGNDVRNGKDPAHAVATEAGAAAAGLATAAAVATLGGPVGWGIAAGIVVSFGVGFVIDEWGDDVWNWGADRVDDVADSARAVGEKAAEKVGEAASEAVKGIKKLGSLNPF